MEIIAKRLFPLPYRIPQKCLSIFAGKDMTDKGNHFRWFVGESKRSLHAFNWFGQHRFIRRVKSSQGLAAFHMCAAASVKFNSGMRIDGLSGLFAACSKALHGPA